MHPLLQRSYSLHLMHQFSSKNNICERLEGEIKAQLSAIAVSQEFRAEDERMNALMHLDS